MAKRPVFLPQNSFPYVREAEIEFEWHPGFAKNQAQKSIISLHNSAAMNGISPILEISSKSPNPLGVALSAFNLKINTLSTQPISVECAFQGSKVFQKGGPYTDLYSVSSKEAKTDERIRNSGDLLAFNFHGENFPIRPTTAFYDWLYVTALFQNPELATKLINFQAFSDIAFNPKKSFNCQARSAALFVALSKSSEIEHIVKDKGYYLKIITDDEIQSAEKVVTQLTLWS